MRELCRYLEQVLAEVMEVMYLLLTVSLWNSYKNSHLTFGALVK